MKILDEKLNLVEVAFGVLVNRSANIQLDLSVDEIKENLQNITVITEDFDSRQQRDLKMAQFLRETIVQQVKANPRNRQPVYLIFIDLVQKECLVYD